MTRIALPAVVDLKAATALADTLRAVTGSVTLDGTGVERIGVAGLQVLLSARAAADAGGYRMVIEPSHGLDAAATTIGGGFLLAADR